MTDEEIKSRLCYHDKRNPNYIRDESEDTVNVYEEGLGHVKQCFCDNCFYGRTKLAEYILTIKQ